MCKASSALASGTAFSEINAFANFVAFFVASSTGIFSIIDNLLLAATKSPEPTYSITNSEMNMLN